MLRDLVGFLFFCVEVIDGAQQCSILQVIGGDIDGIIHRHSCWAGFWVLVLFILLFVLRGSAVSSD